MARKLVSIQRILALDPIDGADRIEVATILGWKVVVQKGLHNVGNLVAYCEIDTVLPVKYFPELEKCKGRIKTIKLRGQISQGYALPLDVAVDVINQIEADKEAKDEDYLPILTDIYGLSVDTDITEIIGAVKYEPKQSDSGGFKIGCSGGLFPSHLVSKTDEIRVQTNPRVIRDFIDRPYYITVKADGTSSTFGWDDDEFFAASRNFKRKDGDNVYWEVARKYGLPQKYADNQHGIRRYIFQGEICGPGIQKNQLDFAEHKLLIFNVFDLETKCYLDYDDLEYVCTTHGLDCVDLVEQGDRFVYETIPQLLELAEGKYPNTKNEREGIVIRSHSHAFSGMYGEMNSFKVISNRFLLKGGD